MKFFTCNLTMHFNRYQNFQTKKKLKELVLAKISHIPQISHIQKIFGVITLKAVYI